MAHENYIKYTLKPYDKQDEINNSEVMKLY